MIDHTQPVPMLTETVYAWRVRLTRGPRRAVYWRNHPQMMTEQEARSWASAHSATVKRVLGSSGKRTSEDLQAEVAAELHDAKGG